MTMDSGVPLHEGIPLPFNLDQTNGTFILILLCLFLMAFIYKGNFETLKVNLSAFVAIQRNKRIETEYTIKNIWHSFYLIFQFALLASVSVYCVFAENMQFQEHHSLRTIVLLIGFILLFILLKFVVYKILGFVYDASAEMSLFMHWHLVILETLGIVYFIPALLLLYSDSLHTEIALFMLISFILVQLILFCRLIVYFVREKLNFLFLIAYLCSVEIIPYILLAAGLLTLYKTDELTVLW